MSRLHCSKNVLLGRLLGVYATKQNELWLDLDRSYML